MSDPWTSDDLGLIHDSEELEVTTHRGDGTLRTWTPIWVVVADEQVYLRTWHRRETGWFGRATTLLQARIRLPGVERDVDVDEVGSADGELRAAIDDAYRSKYGRYGSGTIERMTDEDAAVTTLRITPSP